MNFFRQKFLTLTLCLTSLVALAKSNPKSKENPVPEEKVNAAIEYKFDYSPEELKKTCQDKLSALKTGLAAIGKVKNEAVTKENSLFAIEKILTDFGNETSPVTFLKYVGDNEKVRHEADVCETDISKYFVDIFVDEGLYRVLKTLQKQSKSLSKEENHLLDEYLVRFKRNGLDLAKEKREEFVKSKKELVELEAQFSTNLNEYKDELWVTAKELEGLPESFIQGLKKNEEGKLQLTMAYPHYFPVMENCKNEEVRKQFEYKFNRRGGEKNKILLEKAIHLRHDLANRLGYKTHAHFVLERKMAHNPEAVRKFLTPLIEKLQVVGKKNLAELKEAKAKETNNLKAEIYSWDWRYYETQLKKQKYQLSPEKIKEYFPLDSVVAGMFDIYQTLLGVKFEKDPTLPKWFNGAEPFRVVRNGKTVAYFYMDLFPREGKYGHAAAFTLQSGYLLANGEYKAPVSAIVCNFTAPQGDKPSLLDHHEVETLFHEFGHIMHQVLTKAPYGTFSGTNVKYDFVEAPSQMLQNWVWDETMLNKISGHYKNKEEKLPKEWIHKMIGAKKLNQGLKYLRQASFATIDMDYHTHDRVNTTDVYRDITKKVMMIPIQEGTMPEAGFGHLMGGYDAGYYGYLWSEVYALDMFERFRKEGLLNDKVGADYRTYILEPGGMEPPLFLVEKFLKRKTSQKPFYKFLGLDG